jgi:hypothetical protein
MIVITSRHVTSHFFFPSNLLSFFSFSQRDSPEFAHSDYGKAAIQLLDAFEKKDAALLQKLQQQQVFSFLEIEVLRTFKKLSLSSTASKPQDEQSLA